MAERVLSDDLACALIVRMVEEVADGESADFAFGTAWSELKDDAPTGVGSNRAMADLETRGWIQVRRSRKASEPLEDPRVARITREGETAARKCTSQGSG